MMKDHKALRPLTLVSVLLVLASASFYLYRSTQAEDGQGQDGPGVLTGIETRVEGRLVDWIKGHELDGTGYDLYCEYDARVLVTNGQISDLIDGIYGPSLEESSGLAVSRGERIDYKDTTSRGVRVYRDQSGTLQAGCAPESVKISVPPAEEQPVTPPR